MSRAKFTLSLLSCAAIAGLSSCASTSAVSAEEEGIAAYQAAIDAALAPATPEQIEIAERSDPLKRASFWGEEYRKNPQDAMNTVKFMQSLRAIGSHERVMEVASQALPIHPQNHEILLELGRSFMAQNKADQAAAAFVRSADFAPIDQAAPLAALGVAFDRLERHEDAQEAYREALLREPERMSTLSNYGLSLALTGDLVSAEVQLRKAAALPSATSQVRQNLALILGLQGRYDEMVEVDPAAPRRTVEANRDALKAMMTPARSYGDLAYEPPREAIEMPSVDQRALEEESLGEPSSVATLDGASPEAEPTLRPKLRGSQGG